MHVRASEAPTSGFRGYTLSLVVSQPGNVDAYVRAAVDAGATVLKPAKKSFWGYGAVVQAPDGAIWKFATSSKKDTGPATQEYDHLVLLLGVDDVKATKQFYVDHGLEVGKSFGSKYVEFEVSEPDIQLSLYTRRAAAKDAGVDAEGTGSHRLAVRRRRRGVHGPRRVRVGAIDRGPDRLRPPVSPRDGQTRKADTLAMLATPAIDVWVASASASGEAHLVPLSLAWVEERAVIAVPETSVTARNVAAAGRARLAVGPTRDVVMIDAELDRSVAVDDDDGTR